MDIFFSDMEYSGYGIIKVAVSLYKFPKHPMGKYLHTYHQHILIYLNWILLSGINVVSSFNNLKSEFTEIMEIKTVLRVHNGAGGGS